VHKVYSRGLASDDEYEKIYVLKQPVFVLFLAAAFFDV
jgi:hypothetical protein